MSNMEEIRKIDRLEQMARLSASLTVYLKIMEMITQGSSVYQLESHCMIMLNALNEQINILKYKE